jgi:hypothetical protein
MSQEIICDFIEDFHTYILSPVCYLVTHVEENDATKLAVCGLPPVSRCRRQPTTKQSSSPLVRSSQFNHAVFLESTLVCVKLFAACSLWYVRIVQSTHFCLLQRVSAEVMISSLAAVDNRGAHCGIVDPYLVPYPQMNLLAIKSFLFKIWPVIILSIAVSHTTSNSLLLQPLPLSLARME